MSDFINPEMKDFINDFLIEAKELIENVDKNLLILEKEPDNSDCLNNVFRAVHTIKGTSSFMGLEKISNFTHELENALNLMREKKLLIDEQVMDIILESIDLIKLLIQDVENGFDSNINIEESKAKIEKLIKASQVDKKADIEPTDDSLVNNKTGNSNENNTSIDNPLDAKTEGEDDKYKDKKIGEILVEEGIIKKEELVEALAKQDELTKLGEILISEGKISREKLDELLKKQKKADVKAETTMRVDVKRLDKLMNDVGELVLARNRLIQISKYLENFIENDVITKKLTEITNNFDLLTTDIHTSLMKVRMMPIGRLFGRFPRLVRDLAKNTGKKIELITNGEDTELDKSIAEELNDPLLHLIRNAVDHGIEMPNERKKKGKPETGKIMLNAYQKSNNIIIEVKDDGKGLDDEKILKKAIEKNLISESDAEKKDKSFIYNLIFLPGFSTAQQVSEISGRGVGMDVVKSNISKLRGSIDVYSSIDQGTTILLKIPVTLEIMQALIVEVYNQIYALPLTSVTNVVKVYDNEIKTVRQKEVININNEIISVVKLEELFKIDYKKTKDKNYLIVLDSEREKVGLLVTRIIGKEEIVIKTLDTSLTNSKFISGATTLGDGSVSMVIETSEIIKSIA